MEHWELFKGRDGEFYLHYVVQTPMGDEIVFTTEGHKNRSDTKKLLSWRSRYRMFKAPLIDSSKK